MFQIHSINCSNLWKCCWVLLLQTEVARIHFEYNTPRKKTFAIRAPFGTDDASEFEDIEPPSAPLRKKPKSRFSGKDLSGISMALFA